MRRTSSCSTSSSTVCPCLRLYSVVLCSQLIYASARSFLPGVEYWTSFPFSEIDCTILSQNFYIISPSITVIGTSFLLCDCMVLIFHGTGFCSFRFLSCPVIVRCRNIL
ncbi:hypothetical protein ANCDUO_08153 [Ancylostoma duodenale]|uniref:Uncharacterized protein n=1 Tax=Ancylostoma duodenale TaxID=51022 RepID=A0A0C2GK19_9BILA|nr:hypothetical protein ANCDUO_08153 [Ancylostoma duodenale]